MKKRNVSPNKGLTVITRGIVLLFGVAVITICSILLPELAREEAVGKVNPPASYPFLIGAWILSLPIFYAIYQTLKLLHYIDDGTAFTEVSVKALQNIKICAIIFAVLTVVGAITVIMASRTMDPSEDITPLIAFGFMFCLVSIVVATFVAVIQRLLQDAIEMKSENDLII